MATLKKFLQTGELGLLHAGMSEAEVIALLGPPQDESVERHAQILKYGGLQLTFLRPPRARDRVLSHIGLYYGPYAEPIPPCALPTDFKGTPETTLADVRAFLAQAGLKECVADEADDATCLMLPSCARITFDRQSLQSISFAAPTSSVAKKQISVSIPKDTWNKLRTLARKSASTRTL